MANNIQFAQIFQTALDKQMVEVATSGWMEVNSNLVKYTGGREVKIPKLSMQGLGNYSKTNGYVAGDVTLEWETRTLTQDRGRSFQIDAIDVDESGYQATITNVMGEFQRTKVAPEIDAYRYSTIVKLAKSSNKREIALTEANIFNELLKDIVAIQDVVGEIPLIITLNKKLSPILAMNEKFSKIITVSEFAKGEIKTKVKKIDEHVIMEVPSARMHTAYDFKAGAEGGFALASAAKSINWIITAPNAPIAVSKTDTIRIFDPLTNQDANAWKTDYRKYHDLWITDNALDTVFVNTAPSVLLASKNVELDIEKEVSPSSVE